MGNHIEIKQLFKRGFTLNRSSCLSIVVSLLLLPGLLGCGSPSSDKKTSVPEKFDFAGTLFVANSGDGKLLAFDPPIINSKIAQTKPTVRVVDGNVTPSRQFPGAVSGPTGIFLDRTNDTLYVASASANAILIYDQASTLTSTSTAPLSPTRVITGDQTLLNQPFGVTFDAKNDRIFVANRDSNSIVVFDKNCEGTVLLAGNIAPCRLLLIDGEAPPVFPRSLAIDTQRDLLYISTAGNDSISIYTNTGLIGGKPSDCLTDFAPCRFPPSRVISPHTGTENVSKLELPFGIFIDTANDRLYVVNTGLNTPAVFIYEGASTLNGGLVPNRVITGLKTQLTVPAGVDVDVAAGTIFVINNNSPNNVNASQAAGGNNVDSPSLVVFNNIDTTCLTASHLCDIPPDRRLGGDVFPESGTTLSSPLGVAFDPGRGITYVANTGDNNILFYSLDGNISPLKINANSNTTLDIPSSFFYDSALDRLYITNADTGGFSLDPLIVYDQVSDLAFGDTPPSWKFNGATDFAMPKGVYIDSTRKLMIILNATISANRLFVYDLEGTFRDGAEIVPFPISNKVGPVGKVLSPDNPLSQSNLGLSPGGPTSMTVDEARGEIYVADKNADTVVVFSYDATANSLGRVRTITGLNKPSGVFIDTVKDILYVTNNGQEPGAAADHMADTVFVYDNASTNTTLSRIISTVGLTAGVSNKLKAPISPYVDVTTDRLFLINSDKDQNAVFSFDAASTKGDGAAGCINGTVTCTDTPPNKVVIGLKTNLDFSNSGGLFTGALVLSKHLNNETLYVGQSGDPLCETNGLTCSDGAVLVFGVEGRMPPSRVWSGGGGAFSSPEAVAIDATRNILYVANQGSNTLSILKNADKIDITLDPATGKVDLNNIQLNRPAGVFVDTLQDKLYISNSESLNCSPSMPCDAILVFNKAGTLTNGATPDQVVSDAQLKNPQGITVDTTRKRLYAASQGDDTVLVFSLNGTTSRVSVISGLDQPEDVAIDSTRDLLYVLNRGKSEILVFKDASTFSGNVTPVAALTFPGIGPDGKNFMVDPSDIFIDSEKDLLYLADRGANAVYFFPDASKPGREPITKTLSGDLTSLSAPSAIAVNTSALP